MEELYIVYDREEGLVCVGTKEQAAKDFTRWVENNQEYYSGEMLSDDDMGYQTIMAKLEKGYCLEMHKDNWEEQFIEAGGTSDG